MITETEKGKDTIKEIIDSVDLLRIVIGGGDGSIISFIECLGEDIFSKDKCVFGVVPLGTGNDLSRCLNFGGLADISFISNDFFKFINDYITAEIINIDIWYLKLRCDIDQGDIIEVEKESESDTFFLRSLSEKTKCDKFEFKRNFINYFSLGYEARVGFGKYIKLQFLKRF